MQKIITISVLGAALGAATPARGQNREHLQMAAELRMMQEQNQQLSLALSQLAETLKDVTARLEANEQFQLRRFADQENLIKTLGNDLSTIRERTQDTDTRMRSLSDEIDALRKTFLALPQLLAAQQAAQQAPPPEVDPNNPVAPAPAPEAAPPVSSAAPPPAPILPLPPTAGLSPNRMYDTGYADYAAGQYATAITELEQMVRTFPEAERADDAQYFVGESYYHLNRFAEAAAAYNLVIQNYPNGDQVQFAYYKRGAALERTGDLAGAKASWEEVVNRYPESEGASLARMNLQRLSRQAPPPAPPARE